MLVLRVERAGFGKIDENLMDPIDLRIDLYEQGYP